MNRQTIISFLSDGNWHKAKEIEQATGATRDDMRSLGLLEDGSLIGNTRKGFKLTAKATEQEVRHAANSLLSRARELEERANRLLSGGVA